MNDKERAKQVLLEIIRQSQGDSFPGKIRLFKAFYFAHLYYSSKNPCLLSEWPIVKMPRGPGIHRFDDLISELVEAGMIECEPTKVGPFPSTTYRATPEGRLAENPEREVMEAVRETLAFVSDKTADQLSEITHEFSKTWNDARLGKDMPVYLDLLSDEEYRQAKERSERVSQVLSDVWQ